MTKDTTVPGLFLALRVLHANENVVSYGLATQDYWKRCGPGDEATIKCFHSIPHSFSSPTVKILQAMKSC